MYIYIHIYIYTHVILMIYFSSNMAIGGKSPNSFGASSSGAKNHHQTVGDQTQYFCQQSIMTPEDS